MEGRMNLGQLKAWVISETERKASDKDKSQARKEAEKLWGKWEKQGLLISNPEAAFPTPQAIMCIATAAAATHREACADWEAAGKHNWGPAYNRMKKKRDRDALTTAMCEIMTTTGRLRCKSKKEEGAGEEKTAVIPTAPPAMTPRKTECTKPASLYPVIPEAPPPYIGGPAQAPAIQASILHVKGGELDVETPEDLANAAFKQEVAGFAGSMTRIVRQSAQEIKDLKDIVTEISKNQGKSSGPPPPPLTPRIGLERNQVSSKSKASDQASMTSSTYTAKTPPYQTNEPEIAYDNRRREYTSDSDDDQEGELRIKGNWTLEEDPDGWTETECRRVSGTVIGNFEGHLTEITTPSDTEPPLPTPLPRTPTGQRSTHPMTLRSQDRGTQDIVHQFPLRVTNNGVPAYVPFAHRDMEGLLAKLPPLAGGASDWITTLEGLTMGETLCAGDMRALLGRVEGKEVAKKLLKAAGVRHTTKDALPLNEFRNDLWDVLRREYPTERNVDSVGDIKMKDGEGILEYLKKAGILWAKHTGARHDSSEAIQALWRMQCIKGLPEGVQRALEEVVGLPKMPYKMWVENLEHYYRRYEAKKEQEEDELKALSRRLLRQQVKAKDDETNKAKAKAKQMVSAVVPTEDNWKQEIEKVVKEAVAAQLPTGPPQPPQQVPYYSSPYPQPQIGPQWGNQRRGRGQRGGPWIDVCFNCGQRGHWASACPALCGPPRQQQNQFQQRGGRGGPPHGRGGPRLPFPAQMPAQAWEPEQEC